MCMERFSSSPLGAMEWKRMAAHTHTHTHKHTHTHIHTHTHAVNLTALILSETISCLYGTACLTEHLCVCVCVCVCVLTCALDWLGCEVVSGAL